MADEDVAKQVRSGEQCLQARDRVQSAFQVLNQVKNGLQNMRQDLMTEFRAGSPQVAEIDAIGLALKNALTNFSNGF